MPAAADLDEVLELMASGDHAYDYSVAWIDLMAGGRATGRSVLTRGRFATAEEATPSTGPDPFSYSAGVLASAPPFVPDGLLNKPALIEVITDPNGKPPLSMYSSFYPEPF